MYTIFRKLDRVILASAFGIVHSRTTENTNYSDNGFIETNSEFKIVNLFYTWLAYRGNPSIKPEHLLNATTEEHRGSTLNTPQNMLLASCLS